MASPLTALQSGHWFKAISGASFQHLPSIRSLTLAYTLAGADCIDLAPDLAVIEAAKEAFEVSDRLSTKGKNRPWLMVSFHTGEDPHFRKAQFDPDSCPPSCPRPCQKICPARAIAFTESESGVIEGRCYGCGRCLPVCPLGLITTKAFIYPPATIAPFLLELEIDAIEIHTQPGHFAQFQDLWQILSPWVHHLKLLAISSPDGANLIPYLQSLYDLISPLPCPLVWQTDGRQMSGDIGKGTTLATVKLAQKVLHSGLPGYVQLAGGTNAYTVTKLRSLGLTADSGKSPFVAGVAYGSYARTLLDPLLTELEIRHQTNPNRPHLEDYPDLLEGAVARARELTGELKGF